jgi:phosphonoacetate hydrolase
VLDLVGQPVPDVYSAELSEFVFAAGVKLMQTRRPDVMYLSTTDYIQHKHAPGTAGANAFYTMMDGYLGQLDAMGCVIALTADHGMNAKTWMDGAPDVIYLQDLLDAWLGPGRGARDPAHHRPLCGAPRRAGLVCHVYLPSTCDVADTACAHRCAARRGTGADTRRRPLSAFELPADRIGDLVVVSERFTGARHGGVAPRPVRRWKCRCAATAASASSACH